MLLIIRKKGKEKEKGRECQQSNEEVKMRKRWKKKNYKFGR